MDNGHPGTLAAGERLRMGLHWSLRQAGRLIGKNKLTILIYHQVLEKADPMRPSEPVAETFSWHMQLIHNYFNPMPLDTAVKKLQSGDLPANAICVTFDDGYLNNLEVAQPILQRFDIPATVYIATAFSNGSNMWNDRITDLIGDHRYSSFDLRAANMDFEEVSDWESRRTLAAKLISSVKFQDFRERCRIVDAIYGDNDGVEAPRKMMTFDDIAVLAKKGVDIGAHTVDHPILTSLQPDEQRRQILESKKQLEEIIQQPLSGFAYPNGLPDRDYNASSIDIVKAAGFQYAASTSWGASTRSTCRYQLKRFTPWDAHPSRFHLRLIRQMLSS